MTTLLLWTIVLGTLLLVGGGYRDRILVIAGAVGLFAYSLPALVGLQVTVGTGQQRSIVAAASPESIAAMALAWLGFGISLGLWSLAEAQTRRSVSATVARGGEVAALPGTLAWSALIISITLFLLMVANNGPFFFLNSRAALSQALGYEYLLWRWVNVLGLLFAILSRNRLVLIVLGSMIIFNMIIGDRTVITIALISAFCIKYRSMGALGLLKRPSTWAYMAGVFLVIFFAKSFYVALKEGVGLGSTVSTDAEQLLKSFEPFGTHFILDRVITYDVHTSWSAMLRGSAGQFLIIPSLFGLDSSSFNVQLTQQLYNSRLTYGIAANLWAQGYTLAGYGGVFLFGLGFGALMLWLQALSRKVRPSFSVLVTVVAVLAAVYIHRNSVENYLSFVRQVVLAFASILLLAQLWRLRPAVQQRRNRTLPL